MRHHIGLDLDNTIIDYEQAFVTVGRLIGLLPPNRRFLGKADVKAYLLASDDGIQRWMRLQGQVYGRHIDRATLSEGVAAFIAEQRARGHRISIVSHKTRYGHFDADRVDLWDAARRFLGRTGIVAEGGIGIDACNTHFEETRERKLARIASLECTVFIDDLLEVLTDPGFPDGVFGLWYAGNQAADLTARLPRYRTWSEIAAAVAALPAR